MNGFHITTHAPSSLANRDWACSTKSFQKFPTFRCENFQRSSGVANKIRSVFELFPNFQA